jgi:DNA helicase-2/ATP-dependent DNA helicase PcrA
VAHVRAADLEQLEHLAASHASRQSFLTDLTLDPPNALGDEAGEPLLDEDFLILSTIHSAKGQEWDVVYLLNAVDGCIPSDMATGTPEEIEEERRLLYVAMTRARDYLYILQPHRFYTRGRPDTDHHVFAPRTRFIPEPLLQLVDRPARGGQASDDSFDDAPAVRVDIQARLKEMWR